MGQANSRGTKEEREAAAMASLRAQLPVAIECNNCHAQLTDILPANVKGIPGMRKAGVANCQSCKSETWVLDGTPGGVDLFRRFLDEQNGGAAVASGAVAIR